MPQLNPHPWFLIMLLVWAALMIIFMGKAINMLNLNPTTEITSEMKPPTSWTWPWY